MKLVKAKIINYRSIENVNINFDYNTKIFVGLSETGKSNLLKALNTLSPLIKTTTRDIREDIESAEESYIEFLIRLDDPDKEEIRKIIQDKCFNVDYDNLLLNKEKKRITLDYFLDRDYIYKVDVIEGTKYFQYYKIDDDDYILNENVSFINGSETEPVDIFEGNIQFDQKTLYVPSNIYEFEQESKIEKATLSELNNFISGTIIEYLKSKKWNVLFWKYKEENILPSEIKTEDFVNNPNKCLPLKKLFELYGIKDIKKEYDLKKSTSRSNSFENLLNKISINATLYLKKKWKTMPKDTKIVINESGENLRISIEDSKNKYDMLDRSDGYKRLLSFLILISIDNTNSNLNNSLLLIDCPEAEIDIPGQKYLRDELIEIGKKNYVFYSTHSPYMIDSNNIFRHYIVTKEDEITNIKLGEEADYNDSAVLFNSLGTSLFENVNNINIAFEGWSDKQLYYSGQKLLSSPQKNKIKNIGICQLGGLKNVNAFAATWQLICRVKKYIIISDSDQTGLQYKKRFLEDHLNENVEWYTYADFFSDNLKLETAEDFVVANRIKNICDNYIENKEKYNAIELEKLKDKTMPNMYVIDNWLKQFNYNKEEFKTERNKIKESIFTGLKKSDVIPEYKNILEQIIGMTFKWKI